MLIGTDRTSSAFLIVRFFLSPSLILKHQTDTSMKLMTLNVTDHGHNLTEIYNTNAYFVDPLNDNIV